MTKPMIQSIDDQIYDYYAYPLIVLLKLGKCIRKST
jgi:hypothetical protein